MEQIAEFFSTPEAYAVLALILLVIVGACRAERKASRRDRQWRRADVQTRHLILQTQPADPGFAGVIERLFFRKELKSLAERWQIQVDCERLGVVPEYLGRALLVETATRRGINVNPLMNDDEIRLQIAQRDLWDGAVLANRGASRGRRRAATQ